MLIYGVDCDFVLKHPELYDYTQQELYQLVHQNGGILVQAHPYRKGIDVMLDLNYLDGVEANCHPLYDATHIKKLSNLALSNKKLLTCGGDFHNDTIRVKCGVYIIEGLNDTSSVIKYLEKTNKQAIQLFEEWKVCTVWDDEHEK